MLLEKIKRFSKPNYVTQQKIQQLNQEICKLQNEAIQVPILKAKLDILENELKNLKIQQEIIEEEGEDNESTITNINYNHFSYDSINDHDNVTENTNCLIIPPRNHKRNQSNCTSFSMESADTSIFSMQESNTKSNLELDLQLTYEETNQNLLEKLKLNEQLNVKLYNQVNVLEQTIEEFKRMSVESSSNNSSLKSPNDLNSFPTNKSPTDLAYDKLNSDDGFKIIRNSFNNTTLRRRSSKESLLSLNKNNSFVNNDYKPQRKISKSQYYIPHDEAAEFNLPSSKRHSLVNYYQTTLNKVSPRPRSVSYF